MCSELRPHAFEPALLTKPQSKVCCGGWERAMTIRSPTIWAARLGATDRDRVVAGSLSRARLVPLQDALQVVQKGYRGGGTLFGLSMSPTSGERSFRLVIWTGAVRCRVGPRGQRR